MKINIGGIEVDKITKKEALFKIENFLSNKQQTSDNRQQYIVTVYSEMVVAAQKDKGFREIVNQADLTVADGIGILWAGAVMADNRPQTTDRRQQTADNRFFRKSKIISKAIFYLFCIIFWPSKIKEVLPERIVGVDLVEDICALAAQKKHKVFFLGGKSGVAKKTAEFLKEKFPNLRVAGFFRGRKEKEDDRRLRKIINRAEPDILFIAFGPPHQEKWIYRNLKHLPLVKLAIGVGGSFDYLSGVKKRAPKIFQKLGIEWLWRFFREPSRWRRIINAVIIFPHIIIKKILKK